MAYVVSTASVGGASVCLVFTFVFVFTDFSGAKVSIATDTFDLASYLCGIGVVGTLEQRFLGFEPVDTVNSVAFPPFVTRTLERARSVGTRSGLVTGMCAVVTFIVVATFCAVFAEPVKARTVVRSDSVDT